MAAFSAGTLSSLGSCVLELCQIRGAKETVGFLIPFGEVAIRPGPFALSLISLNSCTTPVASDVASQGQTP